MKTGLPSESTAYIDVSSGLTSRTIASILMVLSFRVASAWTVDLINCSAALAGTVPTVERVHIYPNARGTAEATEEADVRVGAMRVRLGMRRCGDQRADDRHTEENGSGTSPEQIAA